MTEGAPLLRSPEDPPLFYRAHVFVCCNRRPEGHARGSCAARGSEDVRAYMKARVKELGLRKVRVNQAGCLDRCEAGPCIVIYPEGVWYRIRSREEAERVIQEHLVSGRRAVDLMLVGEVVLSSKASGDADG